MGFFAFCFYRIGLMWFPRVFLFFFFDGRCMCFRFDYNNNILLLRIYHYGRLAGLLLNGTDRLRNDEKWNNNDVFVRKSETRTTHWLHTDRTWWCVRLVHTPAADQNWQQVSGITQSERRYRKRRDGTYRYCDYYWMPRILRRVIDCQNSSLHV